MNVTLNLNPNHIELIQYKIDDAHSLKFTFDVESSDDSPTIEIVTCLTEDKRKKTVQMANEQKAKDHFQEIIQKVESLVKEKGIIKEKVNSKFEKFRKELLQDFILGEKTNNEQFDNKDLKIDNTQTI